MRKKTLFLVLLVFFVSFSYAQITNPVEIQGVKAKLTVSAKGNVSGNLSGLPVTIDVLSYRETQFQKILSLEEYLIINGKKILPEKKTDAYGNRFAAFTFNETGDFEYVINAVIETDYSGRSFQDFNLSRKITGLEEFTVPTALVESNNAAIRTIAFTEFDSNSLLETLRETTEWVHNYLEYDISFVGSNASALTALGEKKGVCSQFSELSAAFLRAKNIPSRFAVGTVFSGDNWGNHAWLQAYNPNGGWMSLDPTYGEAGLVDGTHIAMGFFPDPSDAADTAKLASTAKINLGNKDINVGLIESKPFSGIIEITADNIEAEAMKWFDINFSVKNPNNGFVFSPLFVSVPKDFLSSAREKTLLLGPLEERNISVGVFADSELEENQFLRGSYRISAFSPKTEKELIVRSFLPQKIPAKLVLNEIVPLIRENNLVIEIELENFGTETAEIDFFVESAVTSLKKKETLNGLEKKRFAITIGNYLNESYLLGIKGPGIDFEKEIIPKEEILVPEIVP